MDDQVNQGRFIGTFLDSPIISTDRDSFLVALRKGSIIDGTENEPSRKKARWILGVIGNPEVFPLEPESYSWFLSNLEGESSSSLLNQAKDYLNTIIRTIRRSKWDWSALVSGSLGDQVSVPDQAVVYHSKMLQLNAIVTRIASSRAKGERQTMDTTSGNLRFVGDQHYGCMSFTGTKEWFLITYTQLLMLKDMMYARFNAYLSASFIHREPTEFIRSLDFVIEWEMKCIGYYGNKGYELLKSIESLAKCNLTRMSDEYLSEDGSYQSMVVKVKEKEEKLSGSGSPLTEDLCRYLESLVDLNVAVEVFGYQKLSGHPLVDPSMAGRSVREEASKKIDYSPDYCARLRNNCCRLYTEGYIRKNGRWPPLVFRPENRKTRLFHLYTLNEMNIRVDSYPLDDWEGVRFGPHLTFEGFQNYMDLMDDKAVSLYREDCRATWDRKLSPKSSKRLLIELLSREDFSVMSIVEQVRRGNIPASWLIVSLYPKEREMKIAARLFSMMVIEMRVFFAACEANLAEFVYPCLQAQTMTLSKQEVKELFVALTKEYTDEKLVRLYLEVDLSRWNLRWHPEVVDPVGEDLNDMFGMEGVYNTIHHFFKKCLVMVRVQSAPPPGVEKAIIPESDLCFYNHEVGFEGIAQKLWSFLTFGMIDLAMIDHEGPYYLVGQGDNQVLLMTVPLEGVVSRREHIRSLTRELTRRIEIECEKVGQEAKPEECIQSTSVVTYSKNVYIRGVEYHTAIKGCSRIFPSASSDFPSVNGSIGAIASSCTAASELMANPLDAFRLMIFHVALYLLCVRHKEWVESCLMSKMWKEKLDTDTILSLLVLPNDLGGCLVAPITAFLYKGGGDSLSKSVASLKFYQDGSKTTKKIIYALKTSQWVDKHIEIRALLEDPFSIPLRRPKGAEQAMKNQSLDCIKSISKNKDFSEVMSSNVEQFDDSIIVAASSCKPFNPVLLSDAISFSVLGVRSAIMNMFTSTGTIQSLLHSSGSFDFVLTTRVLMTGTLLFQDIVRRIQSLGDQKETISSIFAFSEALRKDWKVGGKSIELVGVTSYVPFEFPVTHSSDFKQKNAFRTLYEGERFDDDMKVRGEWPHYDGIDTKEKRSEYGYKIVTSTTASEAVAKLAAIATQPGVGESFIDFIAAIALTRTSIDIRSMLPLLSRAIGGSIAHRYNSIFGNRGAYGLNTTTWSTHCFPYTDTVDPFSASAIDYPIMIQEMMVAGIAAARLFSVQGFPSGVVNICVPEAEYKPLPNEEMVVSSSTQIEPPQYKENRLVFDKEIKLRKITGTIESPLMTDLKAQSSSLELISEAVRAQIRQGYLKNNAALRIMDSGSKFSSVKLDILEVLNIGVRRVCDIFSLEIAALAGNQTMNITRGGLRWTPVPAIVSLASSAANTIIPMISHPQIQGDPFISELAPLSLFRYTFSGGSTWKKIQSYISSNSIKLLLSAGSKLYKYPEVVFPDDGANSFIYLVSRRLRLTLLQSMLLGELDPSLISPLVRLVVLKPMKGDTPDEGKIEKFSLAASSLLSWSEAHELPVLTSHLKFFVDGNYFKRHLRSSKEVIRVARSLLIVRPSRTVFPIRTSKALFELFPRIDRRDVSVLREGWERPMHSLSLAPELDEANYRMFHIRRMVGRLYGRESNAGYSYAGIASLAINRVSLIVGCGYGSGAAVLLEAGALHVIGLDYLQDLKTEEILKGNVIPPAVKNLGFDSKFTRVEVSKEMTGDIYIPSTADALRNYSSSGTLCFVDIRVREREKVLMILRNLQRFSETAEILWRFIGLDVEVKGIVSSLAASGCLIGMYIVCSGLGWAEVWFHLQLSEKTTFVGGTLISMPEITERWTKRYDLSFLGGGKSFIEQMILGPYQGLSYDEIETNTVVLSEALRASIGSLDHRFTYDQFTAVLQANLYCQVRMSESPVSTLDEYIKDGVIELTILGLKVKMKGSLRLESILLTMLPRLL